MTTYSISDDDLRDIELSAALHYQVVNVLHSILNRSERVTPYKYWLFTGDTPEIMKRLKKHKNMGDRMQQLYTRSKYVQLCDKGKNL